MAGEISSEKDKIGASLSIERDTNVMEAEGSSAKKMTPQVADTSAQGLNSPSSIPNSQGSITDDLDNVSLNPRVEGDVRDKQTDKSVEDMGVRPPSTPPSGLNWPSWPTSGGTWRASPN